MLKTFVVNPQTGDSVRVTDEGVVPVIVHPHPPSGEDTELYPFRQYFTTTGDSSGTSDMRVTGSTTPTEFYIGSIPNEDIYVRSVSILISDAGATLNNFGAITALTNGIEFYWETTSRGKFYIYTALKSNFDFVRLSQGNPAFGDGNNSFRANNVVSTSEAFMPVLNFHNIFGMQWGFRIKKGSSERLVFNVRDNTTGVDAFNIVAYGIVI